MSLLDFEAFIKERLRAWDGTLDLSTGSPVDLAVIQPLLKRVGTDPFTVDAATFIAERLRQEFPDLAASEGDAVTDLLVKPLLLLWDPIIREIQRVKNMLSFSDPSILTVEEAEALGANVFAERNRGNLARGVCRLYFAQPQSIRVSASNFFTSRSGLHYFPSEIQSIRTEEMMLNKEGDLYFFDVNVVAEKPGDEYNIGPGEIVSVANVNPVVRVTNKFRFRFGLPEEGPDEFVARLKQELSERSLVTQRGIVSRITKTFPEVTRLNIVGFNDPEMHRDVISGGSLGLPLAAGTDLKAVPDGLYKKYTRRVYAPSADFFSIVGPVGPTDGFFLTIFDAFPDGEPKVQDLPIIRVIDKNVVEVLPQNIKLTAKDRSWCVRNERAESVWHTWRYSISSWQYWTRIYRSG